MKLFIPNDDDDEPKIENPIWDMACFCGYIGPMDSSLEDKFCPSCGRYLFETPTPDWALVALGEILEERPDLKGYMQEPE